jgi:hypothetical protein
LRSDRNPTLRIQISKENEELFAETNGYNVCAFPRQKEKEKEKGAERHQ